MMKKLMILGASILQLPAIIKAKELGFYVGVVDYNKNAIGVSYADEFFEISTNDVEKVAQVAKEFNADGIMTLATDMPMRSVAKAVEVCGLPGISMKTAIKATDKGEMIKAFKRMEVEHPWFYIIDDFKELKGIKNKIEFPCIMKPIDSSGSRGVVCVNLFEELEKQFEYSMNQSKEGKIIIEEYLDGPEVSVEIFVINKRIYVLQVTDKITTGPPHFVEMGHTQPSRLGKDNVEKIKDLAERAVRAIGIENGPAHVEIILTSFGPKMIELGARLGGDCITTHLVPLSTGIDMVKATIQNACGEEIDITPKYEKGSAIRYFKTQKGQLTDIYGIKEAEGINGVKEVTFTKRVGEQVGNIDSSGDRIGFIVAQGEDADKAEKICCEAVNRIKIQIE